MDSLKVVDNIKDFIDDFTINSYFYLSKNYEEEYQDKIKSLRFRMTQAFHTKNRKVAEILKKELEKTEREFFHFVATKMCDFRKISTAGVIYTYDPLLTIGNHHFNNYINETAVEDSNLLLFLELLPGAGALKSVSIKDDKIVFK